MIKYGCLNDDEIIHCDNMEHKFVHGQSINISNISIYKNYMELCFPVNGALR